MKKAITIICGSLLAIMSMQAQNQNEEMIVKQPEGKLYKNLYKLC